MDIIEIIELGKGFILQYYDGYYKSLILKSLLILNYTLSKKVTFSILIQKSIESAFLCVINYYRIRNLLSSGVYTKY